MPEYPDITLYLECLHARVVPGPLEKLRIKSPFLVRSVDPPISSAEGRAVRGLRRLGKRVVFELEGELFLVFHLMIAGRFQWRERGAKLPGRMGLLAADFPNGTLVLTEAGTKKRASLHAVQGEAALLAHDPGGLEVFDLSCEQFATALRAHKHTVKRALTDPRIFSGIGNSYSDEILHRARLSPFVQTGKIKDDEIERLFEATRSCLSDWAQTLREEVGDGFPTKVTAFRKGMAVHGRHGEPCPDCGKPVQRIVYASRETNYCAECQTGGRILKDRALSQLLKDDWPKTLEEMEELRRPPEG